MTNNIIQTIENLKIQGSKNIRSLQSGLIPRLINTNALERDSYTLDGELFYRDLSQRIFLLNDIRFKNLNAKLKNKRIFKDTMLNLISAGEIYPFALFANGIFIKWSNITIVNDYKYQYVIIDEAVKEASYELYMIDIPFAVGYSENRVYTNKDVILFRFDVEGKASATGRTVIYVTDKDDLVFSSIVAPLGEVKDVDIIIEDRYKLYPENFIVFKDGLLYNNADIKISELNLLSIDNGVNSGELIYKFFYNKRTLTPKDNIYKLKNSDYIKYMYRNSVDPAEYLDKLEKDFDLSFDKTKDYMENIKNAIKYIYSYDACLLDEAYDKKSISIEMTGLDINNLVKNGCIRMLRLKAKELDAFVIMYVNGLVYKRYSEISYDLNSFTIPISDIADTDKVEFVYFIEVNNRIIKSKISETSNQIYALRKDKLVIFTEEPSALAYKLEANLYANYNVDYSIVDNKIIFADSFYYDKDITLAYSNQFRYTSSIVDIETFKLKLPPDFRFCNNLSQYMVYINGKKLINDLYHITIVKDNNPFTDISVYVQVGLNIGDKIEVFYVPMELNNIYDTSTLISTTITTVVDTLDYTIQLPYENFIKDGNTIEVLDGDIILTESGYTITDSVLHWNIIPDVDKVYIVNFKYDTTPGLDEVGYIYINRDKIPYPLDKDLYFIFVNGNKVHKQDIQNISSTLIRITSDVGSLKRVEILPHSDMLNCLLDYMNSDTSLWNYIIDSIPKEELNNMMGIYSLITELDGGLKDNITKEAIINEIVRDYWMKPYINEGSPFIYDYDESTFKIKDSGGNYIIPTMDANKYINVTIEK